MPSVPSARAAERRKVGRRSAAQTLSPLLVVSRVFTALAASGVRPPSSIWNRQPKRQENVKVKGEFDSDSDDEPPPYSRFRYSF